MTFTNIEKRWLEINFYLLCNKIYMNNQCYTDIEDFFRGFKWTNLYEYDIILKTLRETNLIFDQTQRPTRYEFALVMLDKTNRFKYDNAALQTLATPLRYRMYASYTTQVRLREEIKQEKTTIQPKFLNQKFYNAYYSFLLTLSYFGNLYGKHIKL